MKDRIITTAGIAFCSLLITTIPTLGDTVVVPASHRTSSRRFRQPPLQ
jgi:hypothetical protein